MKLITALILSARLVSCAKRDFRYPPCQAIYFARQDEPNLWSPTNRVHLCNALSWNNETAEFTYFHEIYNPDPAAVFSHGSWFGKTEGDVEIASHLMGVYKKRIEGCCGWIKPKDVPEAKCHEFWDGKKDIRIAWGTDETQVARMVCPKRETAKWVCI